MKKIIAIVVAVIVIVSLMIAGSAGEPTVLAKQGEAKEKGVTKWVGQTEYGPENPMFASAQRMCEAIETASDGRLRLTVEPGGTVVPATKEFDGVDEGTIDFAVGYATRWPDEFFPTRELFDQRAGGMSLMGRYLWFISGGGAELAQQMIDDYDYDVHLVPGGGYLSTPTLFLHSRYPVESLADLEGLKMRTAGEGGIILARMGAETVYMQGSEIYTAMQNGDIDAFEFGGPWQDWQFSFQEIADYVYVSGCREPGGLSQFIVDETSWNELPDDLKTIIQEVSTVEAITSYNEQCRLEIAFLAAFRGYGCVVETLSPEIEEAFVQVAREYHDELADEDAFYAMVLESLRDFEEALDPALLEVIGSYDEQCRGIYSW